MARIKTARELSTSQLIQTLDLVRAQLIDFATKETGKAASEFVVRDAMAYQDFSFTTEKWDNQTALTTVAWTKDWSKELPKTKFVAFYGVGNHNDSPTIIGTKFKVGTNGQTTRDVVMHGKMLLEEVVKAYFAPILYKGTETIYVEHYTKSASNVTIHTEEIELFCLVAEPYGEVISKAP